MGYLFASLLLLLRKKSRSAHLLSCKRPRDGSLSLPTFLRVVVKNIYILNGKHVAVNLCCLWKPGFLVGLLHPLHCSTSSAKSSALFSRKKHSLISRMVFCALLAYQFSRSYACGASHWMEKSTHLAGYSTQRFRCLYTIHYTQDCC